MQSLPSELKWIANELSGYSHQTVQINPTGTNSVGPGGMLQFDLPIAKYDFRTLGMAFDTTAWTTNSNNFTALPFNTHSFFATQTTTVGGQVIESVSQRNHLAQIHTDYTGFTNQGFDSILQLAQPIQYVGGNQVSARLPAIGSFVPDQINTGAGGPALTSAQSDPTTGQSINAFPSLLKFPLGFFGSVPVLDLEETGSITLQLQAADASVVMTANSDSTAKSDINTVGFLLANTRLYVNKVNINSDLLDMIKREHRLKHNGALHIPYKRWYSFSRGPVSGSTSFQANVQSQSVNAVLATFTPKSPYGIAPRQSAPLNKDRPSWAVRNATGLKSTNIVYSGEQYPQYNLPVAYCAKLTGDLFENNYKKDVGALVPASLMGTTDASSAGGLTYFLRKAFVFGYRWSLNNDLYTISGLNTMGNSAPIEWRLEYADNAAPTGDAAVNGQLFVETTARLICDENRTVAVLP